jgi:hypothetical protein
MNLNQKGIDMDQLTFEQLKSLSQPREEWCLSLYIPTHRAGPEIEQDRIRYKNLLAEAEDTLAGMGWKNREITTFLKPAMDLLQQSDFWQNQSDGLTVFLAHDEFYTFRLPIRFTEFVLISKRFHLKPILPMFMESLDFKILALSQNEVKLFDCTTVNIEEHDLAAKIPNYAETMRFDQFIKQTQFHTGTSRREGGERAGMYFGHDPKDDEKSHLLNWFHKLTDTLSSYLHEDRAPIILAGVKSLLPMIEQANDSLPLIKEGIVGNPEEKNPQQLHHSAVAILEKKLMNEMEAEKNRYFDLSKKELSTSGIETIVRSAYHGRMDVLFYTPDIHIWGKYDAESSDIERHDEFQAGDDDLIDIAAVTTILRGGKVYQMPLDEMPEQKKLAGILRY